MEDSNEYEKMLVTILETSKMYKNEGQDEPVPIADEDTLKRQEDIPEIDCLKVEDDIIDDYFAFESRFTMACAKHIDGVQLNQLVHTFDNVNFINYQLDERPSVGIVNNIENMVESLYCYDKNKIHQIAEEICYIKKLASHWRTIGGDGNCYYRSAIFGYLENIIFERDIIKLKKMIVEINEKFDDNYVNTKWLPKSVKEPFTKLNRKLVITILYIIYDILDMSNGRVEDLRRAYTILIKAMNNSKSFDIVK
jgi:hypothetical protein